MWRNCRQAVSFRLICASDPARRGFPEDKFRLVEAFKRQSRCRSLNDGRPASGFLVVGAGLLLMFSRRLGLTQCGSGLGLSKLHLFAVALSVSLVAAGEVLGEQLPLTFRCAVDETVTGTNGLIRQSSRDEVVRLAEGTYQIWSPDSGWGENRCALTSCHYSGGLFSYRIQTSSSEDGYILGHLEEFTFDARAKVLDSKEENSSTLQVTGYEKETTIYEHGRCEAIQDPGASTPNP